MHNASKTQYTKNVLTKRGALVYGFHANYCSLFSRTRAKFDSSNVLASNLLFIGSSF